MSEYAELLKLMIIQNARIDHLVKMVVDLMEHRHDEWGRIFVSENGYCRTLGPPPTFSPANR